MFVKSDLTPFRYTNGTGDPLSSSAKQRYTTFHRESEREREREREREEARGGREHDVTEAGGGEVRGISRHPKRARQRSA